MTVPGLRSITLPMPGPLKEVKAHLVELDEGYLLVDTGWANTEALAALEQGMADAGLAWTDIKTVVVTHLHPDHAGNVSPVLERSGARLLMHKVDAENLVLVAKLGRSPHFDEAWQIAGVPAEIRGEMDHALRDGRHHYTPSDPDWPLEGGERISIRGGALEVIWTPGHSAGHICLYSPEHRYLISGDHILPHITPNVGWRPGSDMLGQFLDSLEQVASFDAEWIVPSHGENFTGLAARTASLRRHHDLRCTKIVKSLSDKPLTVHELTSRIWKRKLGPAETNFAVLELLAHLEYLRRRGPVFADPGPEGSLEWRTY